MEQVDKCAIPVFLSAQLHEGTVHYYIDAPRMPPPCAALLVSSARASTGAPRSHRRHARRPLPAVGLQKALGALRVRGLTALLMRMKRNARDLAL